MSLLDAFRRLTGGAPPPAVASRRAFFRRMSGATAGLLGAGLMVPDEAWAAIEGRANRFGIVPGTRVDRTGRPLPAGMGPDEYIGEIFLFGGNFAPRSTALCQGQLLSIAQNTALFSILGTTYGGNGQTTFGLPDLRGRVPVGFGQGPGLSNYSLGQMAGSEAVTLTVNQMPAHAHAVGASSAAGTTPDPAGNVPAMPASSIPQYVAPGAANTALAATPAGLAGGNQPHSVLQPYLTLNFCIVLEGIFPPRD